MTEQQAKDLLVVLITAWPDGLRWHDALQQAAIRKLYTRFLLDLDYAVADVAVTRLIATWKPTSAQRWPTIAELRGAIATVQQGRTPTGGEAWGVLLKLTKGRARPEAELEQLDPVLRACLESMGWLVWDTFFVRGGQEERRWRASRGDSDSDAADRARFLELYEQLTGRDASDRVVGQLAAPIPVRSLTAPAEPTTAPRALGDILAGMLPDKDKEQP